MNIDSLIGTWVSIVLLHTQDRGVLVKCKDGIRYRVEDIWFFRSDVIVVLGSIIMLRI